MGRRVAQVVNLVRRLELDDQELDELRGELAGRELVSFEGVAAEDLEHVRIAQERLSRPSENIPIGDVFRAIGERRRALRAERRGG